MRRKNTKPTAIYWLFDARPDTISEIGWTCGVPFYCGKTIRPTARFSGHKRIARQGDAKNQKSLYEFIAICGDHLRFNIVEIVPADGDWIEAEKRWIRTLRSVNNFCLNASDGGAGSPGYVLRPEHIEAMRRHQTGKKYPTEVRARMSAAKRGCKGRPLTVEHQAKLLDANTGRSLTGASLEQLRESVRFSWKIRREQPPKPHIVERNRQIIELRGQGLSYQAIAERVGLKKQRVWQLVQSGTEQ